MRRLYPVPVDPVDPAEVYGEWPDGGARPGLRLNMIASADGATTVAGLSGGLGGSSDRALFLLLRTLADVVLVGASTARKERYGPSSVPVAAVSRSCRFDWEAPFFTAQKARPIVVTVARAPAPLRARAAEVADVVLAGEHDVDLARALDELGAMGFRAVLSEGGPNLNTQLAAAGLIDELCLTVAPSLVGGDAKRILDGPALPDRLPLRLRSLCEQDGFLFLRWRPGAATPR